MFTQPHDSIAESAKNFCLNFSFFFGERGKKKFAQSQSQLNVQVEKKCSHRAEAKYLSRNVYTFLMKLSRLCYF